MYSDESTFTLVRGVPKMARHSSSASRYNSKFTVKTTKHLDSVMILGTFSGNLGWAGLYFLPKNVTIKEAFISTFSKSIFAHSEEFINVIIS